MNQKTMTETFEKGDRVEWNSSGNKVEGTVRKKIIEPTDLKGHHFEASKENPEYLVESNKTGKEAIHKPESLKKPEE